MNPSLIWIIIAIVAAIAVLGWFLLRRQRTERLRQRFGPEYERAVQQTGDVHEAEARLQARAARVERLHIRPLDRGDAERFSGLWRQIQAQFVDDPKGATLQADALIGDVMRARGYPVGEFEQRVADISVDHPNVVMNYRAARDIVESHAAGRASTEDMRQAMVHYRALFAELVEQPVAAPEHRTDHPVATERGTR